eukprot:6213602-Pleurochrysis_carterae.AAC.3
MMLPVFAQRRIATFGACSLVRRICSGGAGDASVDGAARRRQKRRMYRYISPHKVSDTDTI